MVALVRQDISTESLPEFGRSHRAAPDISVQWTHVTPLSTLSPKLEAVIRRLQTLRSFAPNWDSYGGARPDPAAIEAAVRMVENTSGFEEFVVINVSPVAGGGVEVEWSSNKREVDLEIQRDLTVDLLLAEGGEAVREQTGVRLERLDLIGLFKWLVAGR